MPPGLRAGCNHEGLDGPAASADDREVTDHGGTRAVGLGRGCRPLLPSHRSLHEVDRKEVSPLRAKQHEVAADCRRRARGSTDLDGRPLLPGRGVNHVEPAITAGQEDAVAGGRTGHRGPAANLVGDRMLPEEFACGEVEAGEGGILGAHQHSLPLRRRQDRGASGDLSLGRILPAGFPRGPIQSADDAEIVSHDDRQRRLRRHSCG